MTLCTNIKAVVVYLQNNFQAIYLKTDVINEHKTNKKVIIKIIENMVCISHTCPCLAVIHGGNFKSSTISPLWNVPLHLRQLR